jgi:ABC-type multidrug transport system fused ATPase/permease subunit
VPLSTSSSESLSWTIGSLRPHTRAIATLAGLSLAEVLLRALQPWTLKAVVDYALIGIPVPDRLARLLAPTTGTDRVALLVTFVIGGALVQAGHLGVLLAHGRVQARTAQAIVQRLRQQLFHHVQSLALSHHTRTPTGATVYHIESDTGCLEHLIFRALFPIAFSALTLIVMLGILGRVAPLLAIVTASVIPLLYAVVRSHTSQMAARVEQVKVLESETSGHLHESLSGIALVKSLAREAHEVGRFSERARRTTSARLALARAETRFAFLIGVVTAAGSAATLALGGYQVLRGELSLGTLFVVLAYMGFVYGPMSVIANTAGALEGALVSVARVRRTLALPAERGTGFRPGPAVGDVRFAGVSFAYGDRKVLDDVTLHVPPGELVALVGPSGAGKTTLISLINRFNEPQSGVVWIDGRDARRYARDVLRGSVAVVLQQAILISGSIAENIRYGRLDASDAEVEAAARAAHAHDFIMALPDGYATEMDNAGAALSGGQRQRLSIARAFLSRAPILILDEPTSALDGVTERHVLEALEALRTSRTTFVIAHRLSTVRNADRIVVLEHGRIVAEGRHEALLEVSPLYRELTRDLVTSDGPPGR